MPGPAPLRRHGGDVDQPPPLDLSGGPRAGDGLQHDEPTRVLVAGQAALAVAPQLLEVDRVAGRRTTKHVMTSPQSGSGTPATATSARAGCVCSTRSTSTGATDSPPVRIRSLDRPTMET